MYEKQDLFSNDIDNAGFTQESVICIQSIFIVNSLTGRETTWSSKDLIAIIRTAQTFHNCADSHVEEGVHLFMPRKSYIGLIRLTCGCKG